MSRLSYQACGPGQATASSSTDEDFRADGTFGTNELKQAFT
jgi:hypothetical protein